MSDTEHSRARQTRDGIHITIDREMYEELRDRGSWIGEDDNGDTVHLSEDYQSVGRVKSPEETPDMDAWGPLFPVGDDANIQGTEPVADPDSRKVMLEACHGDVIDVTAVHAGMHLLPERMEVIKRANTYHGPVLRLRPADADSDDLEAYELTCPDNQSHLVLWRLVTDEAGGIQTQTKVATISAQIRNVAGYDICESCDEPIKSPMHRSAALLGACNGGFSDD